MKTLTFTLYNTTLIETRQSQPPAESYRIRMAGEEQKNFVDIGMLSTDGKSDCNPNVARRPSPRKDSPDSTTMNFTFFPAEFSPSSFDVICGTGSEARNHEGNRIFKRRLLIYVERYSRTTSKMEKSMLISEIVKSIKERSNTGFVKHVEKKWYEVSDHLVREKISQGLRDLLHSRYKSSNKAKKQRRRELISHVDNQMEAMMQSKGYVARIMEKMADDFRKQRKMAPDEQVCAMFTRANSEILEALKRDSSITDILSSTCASTGTAQVSGEDQDN
jgi:hypothetical protein